MKSNWQLSRERSTYHFDPMRVDTEDTAIIKLGRLLPTEEWTNEVSKIIKNARPTTWASRGYKGEGLPPPREDLISEEYDLTSNGMKSDMVITHMNWDIPQVFKTISDMFGLEDCMERIHVQMPGEVWNLHIDKLDKWCPENPDSVMRIFIQLTEWRPGQFWQYGNWNWSQWRAGDVSTFDWKNIPHSTANAGYDPRVTFQITGIKTKKTLDMIDSLNQR